MRKLISAVFLALMALITGTRTGFRFTLGTGSTDVQGDAQLQRK